MTHKPDERTESRPMDISSSIFKAATHKTSRLGNFRNSAGETRGEIELPEAAPLVFPALDQVADSGNTIGGKTKFSKTVGDYFDRRIQAKYIQENPDSSLATASTPQFASRFSDPNHPMYSGGLITLASGGLIQKRDRGRRGIVRGRDSGRRSLGEDGRRDGRGRRERNRRGGLKGGIKRIMKENVLYMMIVNMPSEAEMAAYMNNSPEIAPVLTYSQQFSPQSSDRDSYYSPGAPGQLGSIERYEQGMSSGVTRPVSTEGYHSQPQGSSAYQNPRINIE